MDEPKLRGFVGSSSEGRRLAEALADGLDKRGLETTVWDENVFEPSGITLDSLVERAKLADFAVLVATADDAVTKRGTERPAARDNVLLEYGVFVGVLGRPRVFLLAVDGIDIPSDLAGITRLPYRPREDENYDASVRAACRAVEARMKALGPYPSRTVRDVAVNDEARALRDELDLLIKNASAQGWRVVTDRHGTLRLRSPRRKQLTFSYDPQLPETAREQLRPFAAHLAGSGVRVHQIVRREVRR